MCGYKNVVLNMCGYKNVVLNMCGYKNVVLNMCGYKNNYFIIVVNPSQDHVHSCRNSLLGL